MDRTGSTDDTTKTDTGPLPRTPAGATFTSGLGSVAQSGYSRLDPTFLGLAVHHRRHQVPCTHCCCTPNMVEMAVLGSRRCGNGTVLRGGGPGLARGRINGFNGVLSRILGGLIHSLTSRTGRIGKLRTLNPGSSRFGFWPPLRFIRNALNWSSLGRIETTTPVRARVTPASEPVVIS